MIGFIGLVAMYAASDLVASFVINKTGLLNKVNKEIDKELEDLKKDLQNK